MSVNLRDIARECNVSLSTVARVVNNQTNVKEKTRQKVLDKIQALNYDPLRNVPVVRKRSILTTGLVVPTRHLQKRDDYYSWIINTFTMQVEKLRERSMILSDDRICKILLEDRADPRTALGIDRIFLTGMNQPLLDDVLTELEKWGVPVVLLRRSTTLAGIRSVTNNDMEGMYTILDHLKDLGHSRISFINETSPYLVRRETAFWDFLKKEDWFRHENLVFVKDTRKDNMEDWIDTCIREYGVTAVVCSADMTAINTMKYLRKKGLKVPDHISVASFNGGPLTGIFDPEITSLTIPVKKMMELGMMMLSRADTWDGEEPYEIEVPTRLDIRESTGRNSAQERSIKN